MTKQSKFQTIAKIFISYLKDFYYLFYPRLCEICECALTEGETCICTNCISDLPRTRTVAVENNQTEEIFAGRFIFEHASSYYYYTKHSPYAELIHHLKYHNRPQIGIFLGKLYGYDLLETNYYKQLDYIIPIPLHPKRLRKRGYNQCEMIGQGLSEIIGVPMLTTAIARTHNNSSQTKKSKTERFTNSHDLFKVVNPSILEGKSLLIIDDVITTGATIESICTTIQNSCNVKIYIGSIALAKH